MASGTRIEVENLRELQRALRQVSDRELPKALRSANKGMAEVVVKRALPMVPVASGRLKASVKALGGAREATVRAGTPGRVPYAAAVHWGRKGGNVGSPPGNRQGVNAVRGRPFLWEAKEQVLRSREGVREYETELERLFDAVRSR